MLEMQQIEDILPSQYILITFHDMKQQTLRAWTIGTIARSSVPVNFVPVQSWAHWVSVGPESEI
jgi:hypothetical protein